MWRAKIQWISNTMFVSHNLSLSCPPSQPKPQLTIYAFFLPVCWLYCIVAKCITLSAKKYCCQHPACFNICYSQYKTRGTYWCVFFQCPKFFKKKKREREKNFVQPSLNQIHTPPYINSGKRGRELKISQHSCINSQMG